MQLTTETNKSHLYWNTCNVEFTIEIPNTGSKLNQPEKLLIVTLFAIVGFFIVMGNGLVIIAYMTSKNIRRTHFNIYIVNLAIADFFTGFLAAPVQVFIILSGHKMGFLSISYYLQSLSSIFIFTSVSLQVAMSYDRYVLVTDAFAYRNMTSTKKTRNRVMFVWIYSALFSSSNNVCFHMLSILPKSCVQFPLHYIVAVAVLLQSYIIPLTAIGSLNLAIFIKLRIRSQMFRNKATAISLSKNSQFEITTNHSQNARKMGPDYFNLPQGSSLFDQFEETKGIELSLESSSDRNGEWRPQATIRRETPEVGDTNVDIISRELLSVSTISNVLMENKSYERRDDKINFRVNESESIRLQKLRKAGRQLFLIVFTFIACWLPFQTLLLVSSDDSYSFNGAEQWFFYFLILFYINSVVNPLLYIITCNKFKKQVYKIISTLLCL
ncbi:putative histamine H3 receptor [Apostichopus japonicus]|uniref:Putative histamine H3 receptor n=1 Tax=Stichopus japonicus TaxID=307972 RepID=A0A2G8K7K4_STIJA|nr:putative histamine H3 receptor [Apostichopus japonicus]